MCERDRTIENKNESENRDFGGGSADERVGASDESELALIFLSRRWDDSAAVSPALDFFSLPPNYYGWVLHLFIYLSVCFPSLPRSLYPSLSISPSLLPPEVSAEDSNQLMVAALLELHWA